MTAYTVWLVVEVTDEKKRKVVGIEDTDDSSDLPSDDQFIRDEILSSQDAFDDLRINLVEKIPDGS